MFPLAFVRPILGESSHISVPLDGGSSVLGSSSVMGIKESLYTSIGV